MAYKDAETQYKYQNKFQREKYDRVVVTVDKLSGKAEQWNTAAKLRGMSRSKFVEMCVDKEIARMNGAEEQ